MKKKTRIDKVNEIFIKGKEVNANLDTILFLLASFTDRQLTKFYTEFMAKTEVYND